MNIVSLIDLLGYSERNGDVSVVLNQLNVKQPLQRPGKNEDEVNFVVEDLGLELCFKLAEKLPVPRDDLMEGELVLFAVFVRPVSSGLLHPSLGELPFGVALQRNRSLTRQVLGQPSWSSPVMKNDRWILGGKNVLLCFTKDESSVREAVFTLKT